LICDLGNVKLSQH